MSEARCDCCDLPLVSCGKAVEACQRVEQRQEQERLQSLGFIPASYPGFCCVCLERFEPGTLIRANQPSGWRCCA